MKMYMTKFSYKKNFSKIHSDILFFISFIIITYLIISHSISFFSSLAPDSSSYIDNREFRLSIYPLFLDLFYSNDFHYALLFQKIFFIFSLYLLFKSLIDLNIDQKLIIIFYFLLVLNIFYTSFCKIILTESFFFSLINISTAILLKKKKTKFFCALLGLCLGGIMSIKHEGIVISLFLTLIFICLGKKNKIIFFLVGFIVLPLIENYYFFKTNDARSSQLDKIYFGKIFMLSGTEVFKLSDFDEKIKPYLFEIQKESIKVNDFLKKVKNPLLKANLISDFEVVGQFQISDKIWKKLNMTVSFDKIYLDDKHINQKEIFFSIIFKYPFEYFKLTLAHYLSLWTPGSKNIFLDDIDIENENQDIYISELLKKSSSNIYSPNQNLLKISLIFFLSLMLLILLILISYICSLFKNPRKYISLILLILSVQIHLILVSSVNIGTPRYLMPVYPLILLIVILYINDLINRKKSNLNYFYNES